MVPVRVEHEEMQHLVGLTMDARDPGNFLPHLRSAYIKDSDTKANVLKSAKPRAIHRLQTNMQTFAYMPAASSEHELRQAVVEFLQPNNVFTCLTQASPVWPIFVILLKNLWSTNDSAHIRTLPRMEAEAATKGSVPLGRKNNANTSTRELMQRLEKGLKLVEPGNIL